MKINGKKTALALAISSALILTACNDDNSSQTNPNAQFTLTAMDGYIKNALVCADVNENGKCDFEEIIRDLNDKYLLTDEFGKIDTQISQANHALLKKHTLLIATVRTFDADSDIFSEDMDLPDQSMNPITLRAPAGSKLISPITDLVVAKMNLGQTETRAPKMTKDEAQKAVFNSLAVINNDKLLTEEMLYDDYIEDKKSSDDKRVNLAKRSHKVAQIIAESKANAKSDALFDLHSDVVVRIATRAVSIMEDINLNDPGYKPYVAVGKDGAGDTIVVNKKVRFNKKVMDQLAGILADQKGLYGAVGQLGKKEINLSELKNDIVQDHRTGIEALITDLDDENHGFLHDITVSNKETLNDSNLNVYFEGKDKNNLVISAMDKDKQIPGGEYSIYISTNDLNANGEIIIVTDETGGEHDVVTTSTTKLTFIVVNENIAPELNIETQEKIQGEIESWDLTQGEIIFTKFLNLSGLFDDANGDTTFKYSTNLNIPGLIVSEESDSMFKIKGQPFIAMEDDGDMLTITAEDNGGLKETAKFSITIKEGNSVLLDTLTNPNSTWYQWLSKMDTDGIVKPYCQGIKLAVKEFDYMGEYKAISKPDICPTEEDVAKQNNTGTWKGDNSNLLLISGSGKKMRYSGIKLHNNNNSSNITVFENVIHPRVQILSDGSLDIEQQSRRNSITLYNGFSAAEESKEKGQAISWIKNKPVIATADAMYKKYSDTNETLEVNVNFDKSCAEIGVKEEKTSRIDRWKKVQAIVDGKAYDVKLNDKADQPKNKTNEENCSIAFEMNDFKDMTKFEFNQPLEMNFIAKKRSNDSDLFVNSIFDKDGTIQPEYDLIIDDNGIYIAYWRGKEHLSKQIIEHFYKTKEGNLVHGRIEGNVLGHFWDKEYRHLASGHQYQAQNKNEIYKFIGNVQKDKTIWSDDQDKVTIHTLGTDQSDDEEYTIYKSLQAAKNSF